jgi:hypothetical protein
MAVAKADTLITPGLENIVRCIAVVLVVALIAGIA